MRTTLLALGALALAPSASAEALQLPGLGGMAFRAGVFLPGGSDTWPAFGFEYGVTGLRLPVTAIGASIFLSADYYEKDGNRGLPLLANYGVRAGRLRYSAGIGLGVNRLAGQGEKIGLQLQTSLTYDISTAITPVFFEARYHRASNELLSGMAFYVGVRF
jgi:hypothetical protein